MISVTLARVSAAVAGEPLIHGGTHSGGEAYGNRARGPLLCARVTDSGGGEPLFRLIEESIVYSVAKVSNILFL